VVALVSREHLAVPVLPESLKVQPVHIEIARTAEGLPVGDIVQVQQPTLPRGIVVIPRIVKHNRADAGGPESREPQDVQHLVVERRLTADEVVRIRRLRTEEPIAIGAIEVLAREDPQIIGGLERLARAEVVLVVVLDDAAAAENGDAVMVLAR
jgi:hypothetical protein